MTTLIESAYFSLSSEICSAGRPFFPSWRESMKRLVCFVFLWSMPALAQFSSAIEGTVTDSSNSAVPDALVTAKNKETGIVRDSKTSSGGFYRISSLGPGTYNVTVTKQGCVSGLIDKTAVDDLPISGRNPLNLLALQSGVVGRGLSTGLYSGGGSDTL